jgi:hypothetical protein
MILPVLEPKSGNMKRKPPTPKKQSASKSVAKRRYNSPLRQQQTNATREGIIAAGAKLVRNRPDRDWTNLTTPAVGELAGVSERTVQRHLNG